MIDCSPSLDGTPLPAGCQETSRAVSYGNPGYRRVVEVVEGADKVTVVDDEKAGTFVISVPEQQTHRRKRCNYLHVYIAELDMCVRAWPNFRYQPRVFQYPSLAALVRPGPSPGSIPGSIPGPSPGSIPGSIPGPRP